MANETACNGEAIYLIASFQTLTMTHVYAVEAAVAGGVRVIEV